MFRRNPLRLAPEFADTKNTSKYYPHAKNGQSYLFNNRNRRMWVRSNRLETTNLSRLSNYKESNILAKNALAEVNVEATSKWNATYNPDDMRVDDWRSCAFTCGKCGSTYRRSMKARMHYLKGCKNGCDDAACDPVLNPQVPKLKSIKNGDVLARLQLNDAEKGDKALMGERPIHDHHLFKFKCVDCDKTFENSIRAVTGSAKKGMEYNTVSGHELELANRCEECRFGYCMKSARKLMNDESCKKGYYGGLQI